MNAQFQSWFSQGKVAEALSGIGDYFMPDVTYRDEHDFGLALRELLDWAKQGHVQESGRGFEDALATLLQAGELKSALLLMRSYAILRNQNIASLPFDEHLVASRFGSSVRQVGERLAQDEDLRRLLLLVGRDFQEIRRAIGLSEK